ncbi:MAG TPA: lamin tail domain-containing protein, partial [Thermoanaerobaculia bacterium]|nr:lamin tail domain-containing protein [Thermoanaerobaculia bacterium]
MLRRLASSLVVLLLAVTVHGAAFTPGNIVVYRVGNGAAALSNASTAVFLDEYTPAGALVQSIPLPTADSGANQILTAAGTATSEGLLTRSTDGQYLMLAGYDAAPGLASVAATSTTGVTPAGSPIARVIGRVSAAGTIDTSTSLTDFSTTNPRGAASLDGANFWATGGASGVRYGTIGSASTTQLSTTPTNLRAIAIFSSQLYVTSASGTFQGVATVGSGTPTTSGQTTTLLSGFPTASGPQPYQFVFADLSAGVAGLDTVYVADDRAVASGGGIQKWSFNGTTWSLTGTTQLASARGLTGTIAGTTVTLYVTDGGTLRKVTDTAGYNVANNGALSTIASAPANTAFRGVAFTPTAAAPAPTVNSIVRASAENPTNDPSVDYTVTFSQSVTGVGTDDFTLTTTGAVAGANVSNVTPVNGSTYTVTVVTGNGSGTIRLDVTDNDTINTGGVPLGGAGNGNGNFTTGEVFTIDKTGPLVTSIVRAGAENPTNDPSVNYTVTFNEPASNVDNGDFSTSVTGGITGDGVINTTGSSTSYTVTATTGSGDGTIRVDFNANSVTDALGNASATPFTGGESYTVDKTGPTVQQLSRADANPTSASTVNFTVSFGEAVTGLDITDFNLVTTGVSGATVNPTITGSGPYTITVNTGSGSGTIGLDFVSNGSVTDSLGNSTTAGFTGEVYTVDKTAPTVVSANRAGPSPTNAATVNYNVVFSQSVTGVDDTDFALTTTGGISGASISGVSGSGDTYSVAVNTGSGNGTIRLDVQNNGSIQSATAVALAGPTFNGEVYAVDKTAPTVQSVVRADANPTNASSVAFTVTFSENVSGVSPSDFTLTTTGVSGASVTGVTPVDAATYTVNVNTGSGDGTIRADVVTGGTIIDAAGNLFATPFNGGEVYTIDKTVPAVSSITRASVNPTSASSVDFTVTFTENVSGVDTGDFTTFTTGAISGTFVSNVAGGPSVYTVTVNTGINSGTLRLDFVDNDTVLDPAGNTTAAGFTSGEVYTVNAPTPAPVGLSGAVSSGKVALTWSPVGAATSYNVKRGTTPGGPYTTINSPVTNSFNDTTVTNGTRYFYVVTAVGAAGESANSNETHAKPDVAEALGIVISQVYGAGGNAGATLTNDFIEVFNRGNSVVDLTGWSVQYSSAGGSTWTPTNLSGTLAPGQHFLVQESAGAGGTTPLPTPDASGAIAMSGTSGKVALVASTTPLGGTCPGNVLDFVGYGSSSQTCFEGAGPTPNPSGNANSQQRASNGCVDTNNNATDFANATANPRNRVAAATPCAISAIGSATPSSVPSGGSVLLKVELPLSALAGIVTANLTSIGGGAAQPFFDNGTNGDVTAGDNIFSFQTTATGTAGVKSIPVSANASAQNTNTSILLTLTPPLESIATIKTDTTPADTVPDRLNTAVFVRGVVTSIDFRGGTGIEYYIQDPTAGIDVFSTSDVGPALALGTNVEVSGTLTQ